MEFAAKVVGVKLLLVLGHTKCGAVIGACNHVELGNLTSLLNKIKPAIDKEKIIVDNRTGSNPDFVSSVTKFNVELTIERIRNESEVIRDMESQGLLKITGGIYDVDNGKVDFFDN
jgi:carbonic anhydrase